MLSQQKHPRSNQQSNIPQALVLISHLANSEQTSRTAAFCGHLALHYLLRHHPQRQRFLARRV